MEMSKSWKFLIQFGWVVEDENAWEARRIAKRNLKPSDERSRIDSYDCIRDYEE